MCDAGKSCGVESVCLYGGTSKGPQISSLKSGIVTVMKLKVDLECHKCYKKVKKVLAKFPQIRDEKFDEKQNVVTITVVCCSPEKILCAFLIWTNWLPCIFNVNHEGTFVQL
ncbi:hypothetical protein AAHE18_08G196200 [Arachis hypogaea]